MRKLTILVLLFMAATAFADPDGPVVRTEGDENCQLGWQLAEKATMNAPHGAVVLAGVYFAHSGECLVYNIKGFESYGFPYRSPHEVFEEQVLEALLRKGDIGRYTAIQDGKIYKVFAPWQSM